MGLQCRRRRRDKVFPLCVLGMLLCLQSGGVCNAVHIAQMVNLQVEYGESTILPCNGSAYLGQEGSVHWEAMGEDVAFLVGGEQRPGDKFQGRVQLPSEDKLREGDWSVVLQHAMLSDTDMYECMWERRRTISTVWLTVMAPRVDHFLEVPVGTMVDLACYIQISRSQSPNDLQVWWTKNGSPIVSTGKEALYSTAVVSNAEDLSRMDLSVDTKEAIHLFINPTMMSDNGEYRCLYKTRDYDDPKPGIPESITLTVLRTNPTAIVFHPEETTTGVWVSTSHLLTIPWTSDVTAVTDLMAVTDVTDVTDLTDVTDVTDLTDLTDLTDVTDVTDLTDVTDVTDVETTESPIYRIPVILEDSPHSIKARLDLTLQFNDVFILTESQPMEGSEESMTSFLDEETSSESLQWDTIPWIRIGLIAGVLLVTVVVLCILGALRKI
ncbi:uncharacterized protein LOC123975316 isoform X2 [Micropterus dolomieu]|uniref:uncharacterized protein LOC123975316 isoform X2 n=1 Tax=Micropterus dolomieu TaxID=147949 RepID=UPI001E8D6E0C|nr:uncharacterized protein LOC123975316 isoform X2 [Micropterus dolomieu]